MRYRQLLLGAALALALGQTARAQDYLLSQSGFTGGGVLTGSVSGTDSNADGVLDFNVDSITAFSLGFSGDSLVPDFTLGLADLAGLVYQGGGFIGDDGAPGTGEGLAAFTGDLATTGVLYVAGIGPLGTTGSEITHFDTGAVSVTAQPLAITPVPEPRTWALLLAGLGLATWSARRRHHGSR